MQVSLSVLRKSTYNLLEGSAAKDNIGDVGEFVVWRRHPARATIILINALPPTGQGSHENCRVVQTERISGKLGTLESQIDLVLLEQEPWQTDDLVEFFSRSHPLPYIV